MKYDPEEYYPEEDKNRNPECPECSEPLEEVWGLYQDFSDEYGEAHECLIGYECKKCEVKYNTQGEEMT